MISVHPIDGGGFKTTKYSRAYNPDANPNIPVELSVNKIAPDYSKGSGRQYLYPINEGSDLKNIVRIKMTGSRTSKNGDFYAANKKAGFVNEFGDKAPVKVIDGEYVWHHLDDMYGDIWCTMQLVEDAAHTRISGMAHSGSVKQYESFKGIDYK
ncbi:HNH endonuclease [Limibacter armeniacum]|uniref:HNH endonuclease n=1 Tax=Limibacter armeniacum TaxID=466084 RepID=UPI002FE5C4FD